MNRAGVQGATICTEERRKMWRERSGDPEKNDCKERVRAGETYARSGIYGVEGPFAITFPHLHIAI